MKQGRIEIDMKGPIAGVSKDDTITLDGVPITNVITDIEIPNVHVGDLIRVNLGLIVHPGIRLACAAQVGVNDATAALLIELGWTPPVEANRLVNDLGEAFGRHVYNHPDPFEACTLQPCRSLPTGERAALRIDTTGQVISRHPLDAQPTTTQDSHS